MANVFHIDFLIITVKKIKLKYVFVLIVTYIPLYSF